MTYYHATPDNMSFAVRPVMVKVIGQFKQEIATMPLDIAPPRQQTTTAELHYLVRTAERPTRYVMEPPPGAAAWNGIDDPHNVLIEDARRAGPRARVHPGPQWFHAAQGADRSQQFL
jgi:hypothetical protein